MLWLTCNENYMKGMANRLHATHNYEIQFQYFTSIIYMYQVNQLESFQCT